MKNQIVGEIMKRVRFAATGKTHQIVTRFANVVTNAVSILITVISVAILMIAIAKNSPMKKKKANKACT
jgi:hypothetical protein